MSNETFDVVVVGNVGIDTNIYLPGADIDFNVESNFTENLDTVGQAGAYAAQEHGEKIIAVVDGSWTNVVGLPMDETAAALRRFGIEPASPHPAVEE